MKTIIAPTDFSETSKNAVYYAADLASNLGADLSLLYVYQLPLIISEVPVPPLTISVDLESAEDKIKQLKKELEAKTSKKVNITTEIRTGIVINEIDEYCKELNPSMVVMASHGAGTLERFFLASNTIWGLKHFTWPLIIVPAGTKFEKIRRIALACDYKKVKDSIPVQKIKNLVKELQAELVVIHVNQSPAREFGEGIVNEAGSLEELLADLKPRYEFINEKDIEQGLEKYAVNNKIDLLIVIPGQHGVMDRIFHHSHTKKMALQTHVPLMSIHE